MKMSSPVLNCVIIIGSICLYLAVCIMGIDSSKVTDSQHRVTCVVCDSTYFISGDQVGACDNVRTVISLFDAAEIVMIATVEWE